MEKEMESQGISGAQKTEYGEPCRTLTVTVTSCYRKTDRYMQ